MGTIGSPARPSPTDAAAAPTSAVAAPVVPAAAVVVNAVGNSGTCASHDSGPIASRSRPSERFMNARTTAGSNWVPAHRVSSARASAGEIAFLYERTEVITS